MQHDKDNIKEVNKAIKVLENLQGNRSITGTYLDDNCISIFIITLYNVKETIIEDIKLDNL